MFAEAQSKCRVHVLLLPGLLPSREEFSHEDLIRLNEYLSVQTVQLCENYKNVGDKWDSFYTLEACFVLLYSVCKAALYLNLLLQFCAIKSSSNYNKCKIKIKDPLKWQFSFLLC